LVGSATYTWNSSTGNSVSIALPSGTSDRYVELDFTANNVQNGAQVAELGVNGMLLRWGVRDHVVAHAPSQLVSQPSCA
jgi:hypothetical protein